MNDEANNQPDTPPINNIPDQPTPTPGGRKILQPSEELKQEVLAQRQEQEKQSQTPQPTAPAPQNPHPSLYPDPTRGPNVPNTSEQTAPGTLASKTEMVQAKSRRRSHKKSLIKGLLALVVCGGVLAVLVFTNIIALSTFKTISYTSSKGTHYKLSFYAKHKTSTLKVGDQLVSKVSRDNKFPINLMISNGNADNYGKTKDCAGYKKVFDVQNTALNQKISVCDALSGKEARFDVYVAGFTHNGQTHIITMSQDLSGVNVSSPNDARESLAKFGMKPYQQDIEKIISSVKVE